MEQKRNPENWSPEEFKAFLLLYAANADLEMKEEELELAAGSLSAESFSAIRRFFNDCNDYQCLELIHSQRSGHFPGDEGKNVLIAEMTEVCRSDGRISVFEEGMIRVLKRIL